jgi:hypothetical protein
MPGNMRVQTSKYYAVRQLDHNLRQRSLVSGYFKSHCGCDWWPYFNCRRWGQVLLFECMHVLNIKIQGVSDNPTQAVDNG